MMKLTFGEETIKRIRSLSGFQGSNEHSKVYSISLALMELCISSLSQRDKALN